MFTEVPLANLPHEINIDPRHQKGGELDHRLHAQPMGGKAGPQVFKDDLGLLGK